MTEFATNFVPLAPVHLVKPNGAIRAFGLGASTDAARGSALESAVAAMIAGDTILLGTGVFTLSNAITPPAGTALVGRGQAVINSNLAGPSIVLSNDDVVLDGLNVTYTTQAAGVRNNTPQSVERLVIRNCRFTTNSNDGAALAFFSATGGLTLEHHLDLAIYNSLFVGGSVSGFGICACVDDTSRVYVYQSEAQAGADAAIFFGDASADLRIFGGNFESPIDGITAAETTTVQVFYARARGQGQGDVYQDGGTIIPFFCDVRPAFVENVALLPTGAGLALLDDSNAAAQRVTLGVSVRPIELQVVAPGVPVQTGDGKAYFRVPAALNGAVVTAVHALVLTAGTTGGTTIQIARVRGGSPVDVLSAAMVIDSGETGSDTGTAGTINTSNDDLATGDLLRIDVDGVSTTPPQGLIVTIEATL